MRREIDYSLAKKSVVRDYRRGALHRMDVCDAHPELVRAARNLGRESTEKCPICGETELRYVSYVYGEGLKVGNGRAVATSAELRKLSKSHDLLECYDVEVCLACSWNYRVRQFSFGRRTAG